MVKFITASMIATAGLASAALNGYVKLPDSSPVSGVVVEQFSTKLGTVTDANGFYNFENASSIKTVQNSTFSFSSLNGNMLQLNLGKATNVSICVMDLMGNRVSSMNQKLPEGSHSLALLDENAPAGMYLARVKVGSQSKTFRLTNASENGVGVHAFSGSSSLVLAKALTEADSLIYSINGKRIGAVAIWDDDITVDDVVITHKTVSGSIPGSAAADYAVNVSLTSSEGDSESLVASVDATAKTYLAVSSWIFYKSFRTWNVSANTHAEADIADATQNVIIDLGESSTDVPQSSASVVGNSSTSVIGGTSSAGTSVAGVTTQLSYKTTLDISSTDYTASTVDLGAAQVAQALGISTSELSSVTYSGVNPDGTISSTASTAEDPGHWYDANGNITTYSGGSAVIFSELDLAAMTAKVGQYPAKMTSGTTYTIKQAVSSGNNTVIFTISLTATGTAATSSSSVATTTSSSATATSSSNNGGVSSSSAAASNTSTATSSYTLQTMYSTQPDSIWKFVDWVWANRQASGKLDDIVKSKNLIFHQIIEGKGELNYCVKWQSTSSLSKANRDKVEPMLNRMINAWVKELVGYENWPYDTVKVHVVGWAADNASKFPDATTEKIYTSYTESDGSNPTLARCPDACSRMEHYSNKNYDYSSCEMGTRFDMSIWATDGFNGGAGGDWGQRIGVNAFTSTLDYDFPHIAGHEVGHGFGLDDFYEDYQIPDDNYSALTCSDYNSCNSSSYKGDWAIVPKMVMWAGAATVITPADAWMLRRTWTGVKDQFGY